MRTLRYIASYARESAAGGVIAGLGSAQRNGAKTKKLLLGSIAAACCGLCAAAPAWSALTYTFTTLSIPGTPAGATVYGEAINDQGQVIVSADTAGSYNFTVVDDIYNLHTGTYTPIPSYPGATPNSTGAFGINDAGQIVGDYHAAGIAWGGFLLSGGTFSPVTYPAGSTYSYPVGIGNNGEIVGFSLNSSGTALDGYSKVGSTYSDLNVPAAWGTGTIPGGVNKFGTIVGQYLPPGAPFNYYAAESFIYSGGTYTQVAGLPGYGWTSMIGINDLGQIVGYASNDPVNGTDGEGFIYEGGTYIQFNDPLGVEGTYPVGINNLGDIVGDYVDGNGNYQIFVAVPTPEPSALLLLVSGLAGLGLVRQRRV